MRIKDKDANKLLDVLLKRYRWTLKPSGNSAHGIGILMCPEGSCRRSLYGTANGTLKVLRQTYRRCPHKPEGEESPF